MCVEPTLSNILDFARNLASSNNHLTFVNYEKTFDSLKTSPIIFEEVDQGINPLCTEIPADSGSYRKNDDETSTIKIYIEHERVTEHRKSYFRPR